jgi:hypothetical protein
MKDDTNRLTFSMLGVGEGECVRRVQQVSETAATIKPASAPGWVYGNSKWNSKQAEQATREETTPPPAASATSKGGDGIKWFSNPLYEDNISGKPGDGLLELPGSVPGAEMSINNPLYEDELDYMAVIEEQLPDSAQLQLPPGVSAPGKAFGPDGIPAINTSSAIKTTGFKSYVATKEYKKALASLGYKLRKIKATKGHVANVRSMKMMTGKKVRVKLRSWRKVHSSLAAVHGHYYLQTRFKAFKPRLEESMYSVTDSKCISA